MIPETFVQPPSAEPLDSSPTLSSALVTSSLQLLQLPNLSSKQRDKLETISERIETQDSSISQVTSVNQSPPLHRPPKSSKWKWLMTGSIEPDNNTSSKPLLPNTKTVSTSQVQEKTINPFDPKLSDDDEPTKTTDNNVEKQSIPLSLFVPRSAHSLISKTSDDETNDQVSNSIYRKYC